MQEAHQGRGEESRGGRSRLAIAAAWLGSVGALLAVVGPLIAGIWPQTQLYYLFLWSVAFGPIVLLLGLAALNTTRAGTGKAGRGLAWLGCATGTALTAALLAFAWAPH